MRRRKGAKPQPEGAGAAADSNPGSNGSATPGHSKAEKAAAQPAAAAAAEQAAPSPAAAVHQQQEQHETETGATARLGGMLLLAALVVLLYSHHAAVRLLAPQTGDWLAASFCSLALFAVALISAVAGHEAQRLMAAVQRPAGRGGTAGGTASLASFQSAGAAWSLASLAALALSLSWHQGRSLVTLLGSLLLAPGLDQDQSVKISDAELTLRSMALAAAAFGPLFAALGSAAGSAAAAAASPSSPALSQHNPPHSAASSGGGRARLLPLLLGLAGTAGAAMLHGLPPALAPRYPATRLPPAIAAVAALVAAALLHAAVPSVPPAAGQPQQQQQQQQQKEGQKHKKGSAAGRKKGSASRGSRKKAAGASPWQRLAAAVMLAATAAALALLATGRPCSTITGGTAGGTAIREIEGGRYQTLWECEAAAGGRLAVVEGTYLQKYRYRLLRADHSVLGGEYVAPADVAGQSIFTAFYLQQAAALLRPSGNRSLHVGVGVGTAVRGMQQLGVTADSLELHPEVLQAAQRYFNLRPELNSGRALVGDAAELVPQLRKAVLQGTAERYDYVLHDVFSGGGAASALMSETFFRQLSGLLTPDGVLAVNYYGGKGPGLKRAWCRLRLVFDSVRAFADVEKARVRNHVLFASQSDLATANPTAALASLQARAKAATGGASGSSGEGGGGAPAAAAGGWQAGEAAAEVLDPLQLRVWHALPQLEIKLTYDRQRCRQLLSWHDGLPAGRPAGGAGTAAAAAAGGRVRGQPPWLWRQMKEARELHAVATAHWVVARKQFGDALWRA